MTGAPRFLAVGGHVAPRRHHVECLEGVINIDVLREAAAEALTEVLLYLPANDEDELAKAGPLGVKHRVVQHGLAARADRLHLFQSAVTGANAGGQNN